MEIAAFDDAVFGADPPGGQELGQDMMADGADQIDVAVSYQGANLTNLKDVELHREFFGKAEEIGATWVVLPGETSSQSETLDFVQGFGATYITS